MVHLVDPLLQPDDFEFNLKFKAKVSDLKINIHGGFSKRWIVGANSPLLYKDDTKGQINLI